VAERVALVKRHRVEYGLNLCCRVIGVSKSTVYEWREKISTLKAKYGYLKPVVQEICAETSGYGKRRLSAELKRRGYKVGVKLAGKLNKVWGNLFSHRIRKPRSNPIVRTIIGLGIRANLLRLLDLKDLKPFQVVRTDSSQIKYNHGKATASLTTRECEVSKYLSGWELSPTATTEASLETLRQEEGLRSKLGLTFENVISHQDQGSQFTSYEYVKWLLRKDALLSYSEKATPGDNAAKESFYGRFKTEHKEVFLECETFQELENELAKVVEYYNSKRLHSSLGNIPPGEYLESLGYKL